jgi:predicted transcriptional regulator
MSITTHDRIFLCARGMVAGFLLQIALDEKTGQRLAQRDIASTLGISWEMVNLSLKSLCTDGIIRIENNRIILSKELIQPLAAAMIEDEAMFFSKGDNRLVVNHYSGG